MPDYIITKEVFNNARSNEREFLIAYTEFATSWSTERAYAVTISGTYLYAKTVTDAIARLEHQFGSTLAVYLWKNYGHAGQSRVYEGDPKPSPI